jgi:hypothetical protein
MNESATLRVVLVLGFLVAACKRDPAGDQPSAASASVSPSTRAPAPSVAAGSVRLTLGGGVATVPLAGLPTTGRAGEPKVRLADVWAAAKLASPASRLRFDFVGSDGFRPTSRPKCPERLDGSALEHGYIDAKTRSLSWDDSLGLAACYRVRDVVQIEAVERGDPGGAEP